MAGPLRIEKAEEVLEGRQRFILPMAKIRNFFLKAAFLLKCQ